jgi:hypothetical protein
VWPAKGTDERDYTNQWCEHKGTRLDRRVRVASLCSAAEVEPIEEVIDLELN